MESIWPPQPQKKRHGSGFCFECPREFREAPTSRGC
jgi:hypothetical protein